MPGRRHDAAHGVGVVDEVLAERLTRPEVEFLRQVPYLGPPEQPNRQRHTQPSTTRRPRTPTLTRPSYLSNRDLFFSRCQICPLSIPQTTVVAPRCFGQIGRHRKNPLPVLMAQLPPASHRESASQVAAVAHRRHLGAGLGADPQHAVTGRNDDDIGYWQSARLHPVDRRDGKRYVLRTRAFRDPRRPVGSCSASDRRTRLLCGGQRHPLGDLLDRGRGSPESACRRSPVRTPRGRRCRSAAAARRPPRADRRRSAAARRTVRTTPPSLICTVLGAHHRQRHALQRHATAARRRGGRRVGHRQLRERLLRRSTPSSRPRGCPGRPARSAAGDCGAARSCRTGARPASAAGIQVVAVADVEAVLLDDVDDARLHRRHRHRRAVDGQRHRLVCGDRVPAGERQGDEQRRDDEQPQMRRARFMELVQCIQKCLSPTIGSRRTNVRVPTAIDHRTVTKTPRWQQLAVSVRNP